MGRLMGKSRSDAAASIIARSYTQATRTAQSDRQNRFSAMADPTFLGLDKAQWELYNSFSNWVSAFATVAAVTVSLYLARKAGKPRAKTSVGHRIVVAPGANGTYPEIIVFRLVNVGDRPIRVTQIGWRTGLWRKRYAVQLYDQLQSSPLPVELNHGQEAQWTVPLKSREEPWVDYFAKGMLSPNRWLSVKTLRAQFHTSVGEVFEARPDGTLQKMLMAAPQPSSPK